MTCAQDGTCPCASGGFCSLPGAVALGWPKNIGHATAPQQSMAARFAQAAAQVVALSATGDELTSDLIVTAGHKHNEFDLDLDWRQWGAWPVMGRSVFGLPVPGLPITSFAADTEAGIYYFRRALDAGGIPIRSVIYPRLRATVPSGGAPADSTLILSGEIVRVAAGLLVTVTTLPPLTLGALAGPPIVSFVKQWFSWGAVEIPPTVLDARLALRLRARVALVTQEGTLHDVALGLRSGL